ncbi:glycosyltransferase family 4 protein [Microbacterium sp. MYb45]|uniref:glycosyltransferase family 4 protein n=1 Tax=Microbacterium sp. MYb45 TaxID=1827294 RepID=UPI000CFFE0D2|nr:glycosyltransferase family 4 protein [Microbacterium sp. MYb45]PRB56782.1 hypothetical protein CQ034_18510 [Microbacterium sp. MYb45]
MTLEERSVVSDRHIWLVNHHALVPSKDGGSGRHLNMARYLPAHGWSASLIVASTVHARGAQAMPGWKLRQITSEDGVPVLWVRASAYGRSMARRFIGMFVFTAIALLPGMTRGLRRPDVVMGSTVHLLAAWVGYRLAKRNRVPFVYEIRDVWPDALVHLGKLTPQGMPARFMRRLSVKLARVADMVVSPLPHVDRYLEENGIDPAKFCWVSNGFDDSTALDLPEDNESPFTFMYLGAHGNANALDGVMEAFDRFCSAHPDIDARLRFVGNGPLKPQLQDFAKSLSSSSRIAFEDRIPQSEVIARAREADCLVASLHDSPVYNYGISPNKLFTYLNAARPVIFASSAPNNPISEAGSGLTVPGDDRPALAEAMFEIYSMPLAERAALARKGHEYVNATYTHEVLTARLASALGSLAKAPLASASSRRRRRSVAHVSSVHPSTDNRIHYRECASLVEAGYEVTLIAVKSPIEGPPSGVTVLTVPRRRRIARMLLSSLQAVTMAIRTRAAVVHLHDPELIPYIPVLRMLGRTVVYDAHEDLPIQVMTKSYLSPARAKVVSWFATGLVQIVRSANVCVAATETIAAHLPTDRAVVVHNYPPLRESESSADEVDINERAQTAVYVGGIASRRGSDTVIGAFGDPGAPEGWRLNLAGSLSEAHLNSLRALPGWGQVDFVGQVGPEQARDIILSSRVGLVLFADTEAHRDALPTKMFEYFAAGVPVIASDFPLWRTIVAEHECGLLVDPSSPAEVAAALAEYARKPELLSAHSRNARRLAVEQLNWQAEGKRLVDTYDRFRWR